MECVLVYCYDRLRYRDGGYRFTELVFTTDYYSIFYR